MNGDAIDGNHSSSSTEDLLLRVDFENPRNLTSFGSDWRNTYVSQSMVSDGLTSLSGSLESVSPITTYVSFITHLTSHHRIHMDLHFMIGEIHQMYQV